MRRLTNLGAFSVDEMMAFFSAKPTDVISRDKFKECFDYAVGDGGHLKGAADQAKLETVRGKLYDVFDTNGDGVISRGEFVEFSQFMLVTALLAASQQ